MDQDFEILSVKPFLRIHDGWKIFDQDIKQLIENFTRTTVFSNFDDPYDFQSAHPELHQGAFLHVTTETIFDYPHNAYGEKTFKPISCFRPFVLLNVPGALQELRDLGFKTFSNWWSEDYDNIKNPTDRLYAVIDIVAWVCKKDLTEVKDMLYQMQPVLEHNYFFYYNNLIPEQIKKFDLACKKNLLSKK